jgi:hypothetical protein
MSPMKHKRVLGSIALLVPLLSILAVSIWFAAQGWTSVEGPAIPLAGYVAMAAGIFFTLVVGVGLMSLVFYSRRHGYDDAADRGHSEREKEK